MRILGTIAMMIAALAMPVTAQSPSALQPVPPLAPAKGAPAPLPATGAPGARDLSAADVDAWLAGFMP